MNAKLKLGIFLCAGILSGSVSAKISSPIIPLDGGTIKPHATLEISLDNLPADSVRYSIICSIASDHKANQIEDIIHVGVRDWLYKHQLDNNAISSTPNISIPSKDTHVLRVYGFSKNWGSVDFNNLDDTDTIIVFNCFAQPD